MFDVLRSSFVRFAVALVLLNALLLGVVTAVLAAPPVQGENATPSAQLSPELLASLAAFFFSLVFAYVPRVSTWYNALNSEYKASIMGGVIVLVGLASFSLSCGGFVSLDGVACNQTGIVAVVQAILFALVANVGAYTLLVKPFKGSAERAQGNAPTFPPAGTRVGVLLAILFLGGVLLMGAPTARADAPSNQEVATIRLAQEPYLACIALETGMPANAVAFAKIDFDTEFGFVHGITTNDQWGASYGQRVQAFADWLGVPNPTNYGSPKPWCARLIAAQAHILEP